MELFITLYIIGAMIVWGYDFMFCIHQQDMNIGQSLLSATIMCVFSWIWIGVILHRNSK